MPSLAAAQLSWGLVGIALDRNSSHFIPFDLPGPSSGCLPVLSWPQATVAATAIKSAILMRATVPSPAIITHLGLLCAANGQRQHVACSMLHAARCMPHCQWHKQTMSEQRA